MFHKFCLQESFQVAFVLINVSKFHLYFCRIDIDAIAPVTEAATQGNWIGLFFNMTRTVMGFTEEKSVKI